MNLLLADVSYQRLEAELQAFAGVNFITIAEDGGLLRNGESIEVADADLSMLRLDMELFNTGHTKLVLRLIEEAKAFEFVQTAVAGLDNPLFQKIAAKTGVFSNSDAQSPAIAEFVVASVLNRWHRFDVRRDHQQAHQWQENHFRQVLGSNWLIIGYGHIGQWVARQVKGFGANVSGIRRTQTPHEHADLIAPLESVAAHLPKADVVLLSCALNDTTRGIADTAFFDAMKRDAVFVNIGRGDLVDEDALLLALDENKLDYAVLDVFKTEPLPEESPFWDHDRVQLTPHASHRGSLTDERFDELFLDNLRAFLDGNSIRNLVRPDLL